MNAEGRRPAFSITLAVWNGLRWLPACLASIAAQSEEDYELLVLDDGSNDGSIEYLRRAATQDRRTRLVEAAPGQGYARAQNHLLREAAGAVVLTLNQDVELDRRFLAVVREVLEEQPPVGAVQGRIMRLHEGGGRSGVIDSTGLVMGRDRRVRSRDQLCEGVAAARPAGPVWGVDGAVAVYRMSALRSARLPRRNDGWEVFDEDFFMQKEDLDLAWRLRRLGWTTWYEPRARAWHVRSGADTGGRGVVAGLRANMANPIDTRVLAWRNQRLSQIKNDEVAAVVRDLPWIVARELAQWWWMVLFDQRRMRAIPELFRLAPAAWRKRRAVADAVGRIADPT